MDFPGMNPNAGSLSDEATPLSLAAALCLEDMIQLLVGKGSSIVESRALEEATAFAHPTCLRLLCRLVAEQHYQLTTDIASRLMASLVECLNVAAASGLLECTHIINTFFSEFLKPVVCTETVNRGHLDWEKALASALLDSCANCQPHLTAYLQPLACFSSSVLGMALQYASKNGDATSCEKLLLAGAKGDWVDPHKQKLRTKPGSRTAVSAAFKRWGRTGLHEYEACCSLLINTCNSSAVNVRDSHGSTPLKWAAIRGHLDLLIALLDKGADVFAEDSDGNTPIAHAVMYSHGLIVCELIDREPQLYKARINVPSCLKVYESGLLPPTLPMSSRELHLNVHEAVFKSKIPTSVPNVLFVRTFKELKFVESLKSVLACAHNHSACIQVDTKSQYSSQILDHLNILMIRDIAYSCPSLPLPQHICYRDIISAAACIGMRAPMMRLVRAACTAGAGVASFHSREGDSLLLLCSGHNWRDEVNAIIASGCPVDIPSRDDPLFTAIVWAAHKGHSEIVLDLLLAGSKHAQTAMIIAAARCHVSVLEVICQAVASKPASQRPDTSCALLIAAAHGSGAAITALASISPVPQIISDLRCSCVKGIAELLTPPQVTVDDVVGSPSVVLIDRDSKYTQVFRWLLPGAYKALVHHQFEQRAVSKELEWESSDAVVMGFNFKNKLMYAHQNLTAVFGSEDWAERMKLSRSVLLSSVLSNSQPSIELSLTSEQQGYFCCIDASSSEFPHNDCFFVSESVRPLFCFADDVLMSIQTRRLSRQSSFWQGFTCSLQLEHKDDLGHSIISSNGLDLSDVTWMLLIPDTTPLHMVAASGSVEALKTLLSLMHNHQPPHSSPSAAFSATDSSGLTPLCYAARFADTRMCALLLDQGADIKPWEHVIQRTILWINNRRRWRSLLSALVSIHAVTGDLPLIPQHNEATLPSPFSSDECDGLVCVPCVLWAALSGSEAKTRLFVEAGADAVNALAWIQSVGFRYCQENSAMHNVAVKTMTNSQDYVLLGPYAPTARAGDEAEGIQPIPAPDSFSIGDYKRHEVPPGHRVQVVAAILGWNDWTLRKLTTFHDIPQDHYAVTAAKSGKSQQVPGKPDLMQAVQLRVDEFILQAVVVIGVNYVLGVRFTTNQRTLPWMGRNWGDDECKIQRVVQCTPQGREICGFFGLKASGGHGRLLHLGFVARLRGGSDCMRRHRQGVISMTEEWLEPVKLFSMEDALKASIIENTQKKTGLIPRSKTPWNRSPLPGHTLSRSSSAAFLLREFENSERSGIETAVMNHVWTESSTQHGGSKSVFIPSVSPLSSLAVPPATASSPSRRRTSVPKKNQHHPRIVVDQYVSSLPSVLSGGRRAQKLTSPTQVSTKSDHPKHKTTL
jgi:ankyrin repeat protein